ncbi:VWA domain-containing protein [Phytomonospora endophytica]|uniref:Ca-activated chloride channel family protein n=1 Tax=Phytomonospora endophytica TaxID=714109 RepID=A0A841FY86_9ACTN|nr:extracellular solute-binding protein [Phytomonospora endophytica]MBB6036930.1 Ca-activated chloride channel family protein [Phytomonospora endophytica]GIG68039.1 VWA domain-containing protein [Phytomonospora endophytica]
MSENGGGMLAGVRNIGRGRPTLRRVLFGVAIATVALLLFVVGVNACSTGPAGDCVAVEINSSTEKSGLITELAEAYGKSGREFTAGRCAEIAVHKTTSGAAMEALSTGWDEQRDGAPVPQVWLPTSSLWLSVMTERADTATILPPGDSYPSVANSPLVIAMLESRATALGWPSAEVGWRDIFELATSEEGWAARGHPEWGRFTFGKDNPHLSTSGMAATIATFYAATGITTELTPDRLGSPEVEEFVHGVEKSVLHYSDDGVGYIKNLYAADAEGKAGSYVSAIAMQEQLVHLYNQGSPNGDPALIGSGAPSERLVTLYPSDGTLVMDHPYVVLPNASEDQRAAAADFLAFISEGEQQKRFQDLGFRSNTNVLTDAVAGSIGAPDNRTLAVIEPPKPHVLTQILDSWDRLRKRARILLVMDVSGSMNDPAVGGLSRLEAAKQAAVSALGRLHPQDELALWEFSDEAALGTRLPYHELRPLREVGDSTDDAAEVINGLNADGGTALYTTVRAAHEYMVEHTDPEKITAVVILTDGKNEYSADNDLGRLLTEVDAANLERSVRVFSIAFGEQADFTTLDKISETSRATAYDARDPSTIDKVFVSVLSNF